MKNLTLPSLVAVGTAISLVGPAAVHAQEPGATRLEEIVVTARKREESLVDVPISISVFNAQALIDQGIDSQEDLFAATPGLSFTNWSGSRTGNNPGIRGIQSDLRASNQQKVTSFIDGVPVLNNHSSLQFTGIDAVEIYRGPQSAAFGRSTFAGAINYVTSDASEEFTSKVMLESSDIGSRQAGVLFSGPIGENLGYRVPYVRDDFDGPDEWTATDGVRMGIEETEDFYLKLNFDFSDTVYGEISYNRMDTLDQAGATWIADISSCLTGSGVYRSSMMVVVEQPSGKWDCNTDVPSSGIGRNHDVLSQFLSVYDANRADYEGGFAMGFAMLDTNTDGILQAEEYLAQTFADGQTYEQALLGQTIPRDVLGTDREVTRIHGELNFEIGDSLLQFFAMSTEDSVVNWNENDYNGAVAAFDINMMTMQVALTANLMSMLVPIDIEERYLEARWVSPESERLRYTLAASYYDYDLQQQVFNNGGAWWRNLIVEAGPNAGSPVNPNSGITISEVAENFGASVGLQYDLTDRTTFSLEGRYQVDEVCGIDQRGASVQFCQETKAFLPRISLNTTFSESTSGYIQLALGNNPAGVNIAYQDPGNIQALLVASGQIPVPALADDGVTIPINSGVQYDGAGGNPPSIVSYDASTFPEFEEEELMNFEVGLKGTFADGRGRYTGALFFMDWTDIVGAENLNWDDTDTGGWNEGVWTTFDGERTWINQGDGEVYGLELDVNFAVNDIWTVGGYLTLSSAKYTDYCSIQAPDYFDAPAGGTNIVPILTPEDDGVLSDCGVVDGNWLPRQTPVSGSLNFTAFLPNDIFGLRANIRADIRHNGAYYEDHLNLLEREAITTVNLSANLRNENWLVRLYVDNVTDVRDPLRIFQANDYFTPVNVSAPPVAAASWAMVPRRPREAGLQIQYQF